MDTRPEDAAEIEAREVAPDRRGEEPLRVGVRRVRHRVQRQEPGLDAVEGALRAGEADRRHPAQVDEQGVRELEAGVGRLQEEDGEVRAAVPEAAVPEPAVAPEGVRGCGSPHGR